MQLDSSQLWVNEWMTFSKPLEQVEGSGLLLQRDLVKSLRNRSVYGHPTHDIRIIETHISFVILTGLFVYKIKKSLRLGFLDFSTLEKRRFYCERELDLNRRLAPDLYLSVVAITGSVTQPNLDGEGEVLDFAVKMVQFDSQCELHRLLGTPAVGFKEVAELATVVARFHHRVSRAKPGGVYGSPDRVLQRVKDNFDEILPCLNSLDTGDLDELGAWVDVTYADLEAFLLVRKENGFVRECHGDMHLGNMVLIEGKIRLFDCLEFNDQLRWIDVMSEIAFLFMDLEYRQQPELAYQFLNKYLVQDGDYAGLRVFPFYCMYRAMVRAKVACIRYRQTPHCKTDLLEVNQHLALARRYTRRRDVQMIITHGFSGSGKSWVAERVSRVLPAIHIRSDVERDRVIPTHSLKRDAKYSDASIESVYERLLALSGVVLNAGFSVLVDATFNTEVNRSRFRQLADDRGVNFTVIDVQCPESLLRSRVESRLSAGKDASEATVAVLEQQLRDAEPLRESKGCRVVRVKNDGTAVDFHDLARILTETGCPASEE